MDKEKDRLEQAYTDRETETAQFILIDTNMAINQRTATGGFLEGA